MTQPPPATGPSAPLGPVRPARGQSFERRVTGLDVVLAFLAIVAAPVAAGVLVAVAGLTLEADWLLGASLPTATVVAGLATWASLIRRGWSWRDLGFVRGSRTLMHLWWEVPLLWVAAVLLTVIAGTSAGLSPSGPAVSGSSATDALELGLAGLVATQVCAVLLFPALEEILFRRVLFGWIAQRRGAALAVVGSALAFGLVHVAPPIIVLQFFIGLGAALLVRGHGTLWASLALHAFNNAVVAAAVLTALS